MFPDTRPTAWWVATITGLAFGVAIWWFATRDGAPLSRVRLPEIRLIRS